MSADRTPSVPAVERALALLELIAGSRSGLTLSQLVQASDLPKSSLHCLLLTLERCGYLQRNERTSRYMFGSKLFSLANASLGGLRVREQAMALIVALAQRTGLTVHLGILDQADAVLVAKYDPPNSPQLATWLDKRMEVHCTGLGKVLIAYQPDEVVDQIARVRGFPRHNENTITSVRRLKEDLLKTRRRGYAIDDEEDEIGLRCLGAPVFDDSGSVVAAVSIAGSVNQVNSDATAALSARLLECAHAISARLGYRSDLNMECAS